MNQEVAQCPLSLLPSPVLAAGQNAVSASLAAEQQHKLTSSTWHTLQSSHVPRSPRSHQTLGSLQAVMASRALRL